MIILNNRNIDKVMHGSESVSKIYRGNELVWEYVKRYGGIEVYTDFSYYPASNGALTDFSATNNYFLALVDSGDATTKRVQYGYNESVSIASTAVRIFESLDATSVDYWSITSNPRVFNFIGRYFVFSISRAYASKFFAKNSTTGEYYIKGLDVT